MYRSPLSLMAYDFETDIPFFLSTDDFAVIASYTPTGGSAASLTGILDKEFLEYALGGVADISNTRITFTCAKSDVPAPQIGDALTASETDFYVLDFVDDKNGILTFYLEEA